MRNLQLIEKRIDDEGYSLDVVDVFKTIQGEGPFAGVPAVFVRTAGCNLQCPACDTNYTANRFHADIDFLQRYIGILTTRSCIDLVVITGGEPFRQPLGLFVEALIIKGYRVQIETNGTIYHGDFDHVRHSALSVVCSPKAGVNERLKPRIGALKYVMGHKDVSPIDGLPLTCLDSQSPVEHPWEGFVANGGLIYVQPLDSGDPIENKKNMEACIESCMRYGYILSTQLHKMWELS